MHQKNDPNNVLKVDPKELTENFNNNVLELTQKNTKMRVMKQKNCSHRNKPSIFDDLGIDDASPPEEAYLEIL